MTVDPKVVSRGKGFNSLLREFLTAAQVSFSRAPDPKVVLSKYVTTCAVETISLEDQLNALLRHVSSNGPHTCQSFATPRGSHYDRVNSSDPKKQLENGKKGILVF